MSKKTDKKTCFVIGPIGEEGSDIRRIADWLLKGVVKPVLEMEPFKYTVTRADGIPDPGLITHQIINMILDADLVVADLTGQNPNAFYELALRHMAGKPVIHMIMDGQSIPFDNKDYRTIPYNIGEYESLETAKRELTKQANAVSEDGYKVSNPVTEARGYKELTASGDTRDQMSAQLMDAVGDIKSRLSAIERNLIFSNREQLPHPFLPDSLAGRLLDGLQLSPLQAVMLDRATNSSVKS